MDIKGILRSAAPMLGAAIGGPFGSIAAAVVAKALGLPEDAKPDDLPAAMAQATPEQIAALRAADQAFEVRMKELGFANAEKLAALAVDNTKDARDMQRQTRSLVPALLTGVTVAGFFVLLIGAAAGAFVLQGSDVLMLLLGVLARETASVYNFWLGSSDGSRQKTEIMKGHGK
jgi:hypothetical protein